MSRVNSEAVPTSLHERRTSKELLCLDKAIHLSLALVEAILPVVDGEITIGLDLCLVILLILEIALVGCFLAILIILVLVAVCNFFLEISLLLLKGFLQILCSLLGLRVVSDRRLLD